MLNTYDVLKQISDVWDDMSNAEKSSLAITLAKKTQMDSFLSILSNFDSAERALVTSLNSEGSAWKENEAYMESIEAHMNKLKAEFSTLVLSTPIRDLEKALLSAGTAILKFANSDVGQTIIKLTTLATTVLVANKALQAFQALLMAKNATSIFASATVSLIAQETTLTQVTEVLTIAMLKNPLFWGITAIAGITAIITAIKKARNAFKDSIDAVKESTDAYKEAQNEVDGLVDKLKTLQEQIDKNNSAKLEITDDKALQSLQKETNELIRQEAILKNQLVIAQKKAEISAKEKKDKAEEAVGKQTSGTVYNTTEKGNVLDLTAFYGNVKQVADAQISSLQQLQEDINKNNEALSRLTEGTEEYYDTAMRGEALVSAYEKIEKELINNVDSIEALIEAGGDENGLLQDLINKYTELIDKESEIEGLNKITQEDIEEIAESAEDATESIDDLSTQASKLTSQLTNAESAYATINKALEELSENGGYSAETIQQLAMLGGDWITILEQSIEDGEIAKTTTDELTETYRALAIAELQAQASQDMQNIALGNLAEISPIAQQAIQNMSNEAKVEAQNAREAAKAELLWATATEQRKAVQNDETLDRNARSKRLAEINAVQSEYQKLIDQMNTWTIDGASSSDKKGGKSSKSKETDKYLEAFKKEKEALKHQLEMDYISEKEYYDSLQELNERYFGIATGLHQKYLEQYTENEEEVYKGLKSIYDQAKDYLAEAVEESYQDAINILEKEEKTVLANIKKQIDAVKKEQEVTLKGIRNQIETLKDEKSTVKDYWDDQINAIKEANEEIEKQTELLKLQQALAEAKAKKVMVMGESGQFELGENESAVATAEKNLSDYQDKLSSEQQIEDMEKMRDAQLDNLQARIDDLENYYDYMKDYYDNQIDSLQEYYDKTQEVYDNQKQALQDQLDAFKDSQKEYENIQNAKLATQVMAMDAEAENWNTELANLRNYINQYNAMLTQLGTAGKYVGYSYEAGKGINPTPVPVGGGVPKHASGIASVTNDEIALVGEGKNAELVIGAKRNQGALMSLPKGSGVVNAESTQTLAGVLNSLASPKRNNSNMNGVTQMFTFGNISLPNVTDANSFVKELSNKFNNYAIQYSSIRE